MSKALTPKRAGTVALANSARKYAQSSKAEATQRRYRSAWAKFNAWCEQHGLEPLPASVETVAAYLTALADAGQKVSAIGVERAAIGAAHRLAGYDDPTRTEVIRALWQGITRQKGMPPKKKAPVTRDELRAMVEALPASLTGQRDRALLLLGFAGAFRRSELVAVDVDDIHINAEAKITIKRSKTDQEGHGMVKSIPASPDPVLDPVRALRDWLNAAAIKSGPVFRQIDRWGHVRDRRLTAQSVTLIVKAAAEAAGLEPRQFAGHSLRAGFITAAAEAGAHEWEIQEQTGHRSERVLRGYIQAAGRGAKKATLAALTGKVPKNNGE
jgi:site-specific recombinase XerD